MALGLEGGDISGTDTPSEVRVAYFWGAWSAANQMLESGASSFLSWVPELFSSVTGTSDTLSQDPAPPGPAPTLPTLTDALVHVGVAGIEVSRWAGWQADAHLADVVPLQQDEELG